MARVADKSKAVRFYTPRLLDQNDTRHKIPDAFWNDIMDATTSIKPEDRILPRSSGRYYGATRTPKKYARYLRVGVLRGRGDWPDTVEFQENADQLQALVLEGEQQLFESAYVVPFGLSHRIAVMGPVRGYVTPAGMEDWLTFIAGHEKTPMRIELVPEVDKKVIDKLEKQALSLSKINVRFAHDSDPDVGSLMEGGSASRAIGEAVSEKPGDASLEITMSAGNRDVRAGTGKDFLDAAKRLVGLDPERLEVTMKLPSGADEIKTETHDILRDLIVFNVDFVIDDNEEKTEQSVLAAINDAVQVFNQRVA